MSTLRPIHEQLPLLSLTSPIFQRCVTRASARGSGHPFAQRIIEDALKAVTPATELTFNLTSGGRNISMLREYIGKSGTLRIDKLAVKSIEEEDALLLAAET